MNAITVILPDALDNWVQARVAEGRYADAGDYLRDLVRRDSNDEVEDTAWVRAMVEEGLASGIVDAEPEDVLKEIMAQLADE